MLRDALRHLAADRQRVTRSAGTCQVLEAKWGFAMPHPNGSGEKLTSREKTIGLTNPDGATGARRLRLAEEMAHQEYHAALVSLKNFLFRPTDAGDSAFPQR